MQLRLIQNKGSSRRASWRLTHLRTLISDYLRDRRLDPATYWVGAEEHAGRIVLTGNVDSEWTRSIIHELVPPHDDPRIVDRLQVERPLDRVS